eukprot:3692108-Ditylum_brightwellii.AAC.1
MSLEKYKETFVNSIGVVTHGKDMLKIDHDNGNTKNATLIAESITRSTEAYITYVFITGANYHKYAKLLEDLSNSYAPDKDECPKTLAGSHKLLATWENECSQSQERPNNS